VDHLGSTRLITDQSGNAVSCYDHYPFGEEIEANNSHGDRQIVPCYNKDKGIYQRFTGKERDDESGLDYFGARYFSASLGRFTGPDVPLLDQSAGNPQSWNLYGYVRNNPLKFTDPNGQICIFGFGNTCEEVEPPQPPPPPSVPEGAPGTRTFPLIQAQDAVRQNPRLQPEREGARRTFCNFATCQTAIPLGAPVGEDGLITTPEGHGPRFSMANEMARKLPQSGEFTEVGPEDAQAIANEGGVAIGVLPARGHGHVVTVRPDNTYLEAGATRQGSGPLLNDVGRYVRVARASRVFGSAQPRYYVPTDPTPRNNSHLRRLGR